GGLPTGRRHPPLRFASLTISPPPCGGEEPVAEACATSYPLPRAGGKVDRPAGTRRKGDASTTGEATGHNVSMPGHATSRSMKKLLVLGGTTEARQLAAKLVQCADVMLSLAGRTENPVAQGVPVRVGGFGGVEGLAAYLKGNGIDLLIDATHP